MMNQELLNYIKQQLQKGVSNEAIRDALVNGGWQVEDVNRALDSLSIDSNQFQSPPIPQGIVTALRSPVALLRDAWSIYKQKLSIFLGITIVPVLVTVLIGISLISIVREGQLIDGNIGKLLPLLILYCAIILISQMWGQVALLYAIKDRKENVSILEVYRRGWRKLLSYTGVIILVTFMIAGGSLLLIIPGIIFLVWFYLAGVVCIAEGVGGMNALMKSREYVRNRWTAVFWRIIFIGGLSIIFNFILSFLLSVLHVPLGTMIRNFISMLLMIPITMIYMFLLYDDLKSLRGKFIFAPAKRQKILLLFLVILGIVLYIIVGIAVPKITDNLQQDVENQRREIDLNIIKSSLDYYYYGFEHDSYPSSLDQLLSDPSMSGIISIIPTDPETGEAYYYQLQSDGKGYRLCSQFGTEEQECVTSHSAE